MKVDSTKISTWSTGGVGGKSAGAAEGGSGGTGKLPVQPGSNQLAGYSISADTFDTSTTTSGTVKGK